MKRKENLKNLISVAAKNEIADLVIKNIEIVDVFTQSLYKADVAIKDGYIVGTGNYNGIVEIDGNNKYISPSFIDAHMHLESSLVTPDIYEKYVLPHGVTAVIADPHEIANVAGKEGIDYFLNATADCTLDFHTMLPSCVPATSLDIGGAVLKANDIKNYYKNKNVHGLAEVMDALSIVNCDPDMIAKLNEANKHNLNIDGHCAGFDISVLNAYITANISTDHECQSTQEVLERLRRGMYVLMREGTAAKNLRDLAKIITPANSRRVCLCTDDKHIDEISGNGTINEAVRIAIEEGLPAPLAYQLATLNTAECYNLKKQGAIAPGYKADFIILSDLNNVKIEKVFKDGILVAENGKTLINSKQFTQIPKSLFNSVKLPEIKKADLEIKLNNSNINIIEFIPNKLETNHIIDKVNIENGIFKPDIEKDYLSLLVIDRFTGNLNIGKGVIKGFSLKSGAIATTIAHDSHNIILIGTNTDDMLLCLNKLKEIQGGIVYADNNKIKTHVRLEVGGLISHKEPEILLKQLDELHHFVKMDNHNFNPFLALSFLALSVIPEIKLTAKGLYSSKTQSLIELEAK